jgi:thioredoxin reductase
MEDVVVVGAGVAGLSAALILGRSRRRVVVLDAGDPRNAPAEHAHGLLSRDGIAPKELLQLGREDVRRYPSVTIVQEEAASASRSAAWFTITLRSGKVLEARKLVLASGVTDVVPDIPGLQELWGRGVYHCPYCHGWEVRDTVWGVLSEAHVQERLSLYRGWASRVIVLVNGPSLLAGEERQRLVDLGGMLDERRISRVEDQGLDGVRIVLEDGADVRLGALFVLPSQVQRSQLAEALGCELVETGPTPGRFVKVDGTTGETTVPGVYAAGDMTGPAQSLILAAASGARAAYHLNHALAAEDAAFALAAK